MGRRKYSDAETSMRTDGHFILLEYGQAEAMRNPGDWPSMNSIYKAGFGKGGGQQPTPLLPAHLQQVPVALKRLSLRQQRIVFLSYVEHWQFFKILQDPAVCCSKKTHDIDLHEAQVAVAMWCAAHAEARLEQSA